MEEEEVPKVILTTATGRMAGGDLKAHTKHNRRALTALHLVYIPSSTLLKGA